MIHALPTSIRGATHAKITQRIDHPSSGIVLRYQLGSVGPGGQFQPDRLLREVRRFLRRPEAEAIRQLAADAQAPTTNGEQEYRWADVLAYLDADPVRWEPR